MKPFEALEDLGKAWRPLRGLWLMVGLSVLVGLASGLLAVGLREGVHFLFDALEHARDGWLGVLLPAAGAFLGVGLVRFVFREPGGHGVPEVLLAVSRRGGTMRRRSMISRLLGSMVNVASGGSAGLEGPIVYSAAAVGSALSRPFRLAERQSILLLACGVAGGIAAIFNAPLTGLIFATEVVLAEWSLAAVVPIAVCATVATEVGRSLLGNQGAFDTESVAFAHTDLAACIPLGFLCGITSIALVRSLRGMEGLSERVHGHKFLGRLGVVAAIGGLGVGLIGLVRPGAIGEGYDTVMTAIGPGLDGGVGVLFVLLAAKMLASALTLGSGAPGGVFAPSLVIGAVLGSLYGKLVENTLPDESFAEPSFYALVAMAGLVAGTMQAPFTGIFLVLETTGGWELTLPLMLAAVLSVLLTRSVERHSFYTHEIAHKGLLLRPGTDRRITADLGVGEILDLEAPTVPVGSTLEQLRMMLPNTKRNHMAVVDPESGKLHGVINVASLRGFIFDATLRAVTTVDTVMEQLPTVPVDASMNDVLKSFDHAGAWVLPVVDGEKFVGMVSKSTLFERYRRELIVQTSDRG